MYTARYRRFEGEVTNYAIFGGKTENYSRLVIA